MNELLTHTIARMDLMVMYWAEEDRHRRVLYDGTIRQTYNSNRPILFLEKQMEWRESLMIKGSWAKVGKCGYYHNNDLRAWWVFAVCWVINISPILAHLIPTKTLRGQYYYCCYSHITDEKTKARRGYITCPKSDRWQSQCLNLDSHGPEMPSHAWTVVWEHRSPVLGIFPGWEAVQPL